ncbi:hypothetical protein QA639_21810 [Bradyrhizobium pachyrhizi]|uniref:hypothetical protein n=1 Tax=Bradyrhizobium pachyrhizi TaxID=280333 RepID=UPI0024B15E16|nr:hypothetical protein [Bradyrhizobium pachyrhizi]WFU52346.1 hypothetical protein QA639_21810 [Bradyrhizobium pachyrhizi]
MTQKITNIVVVSAGPLSFAATRIETEGEKPQLKFRMICGDEVLADMGGEAARFFTARVQETFAIVNGDEWTRHPTYAAVEADRKRIAARSAV